MIKVISAARRKADLSPEEFERRMRAEHAPLVARLPGLEGYVANFPVPEHVGAWDTVVELTFANVDAFRAALASPIGQEVLTHMRTLIDGETIQTGMFRVRDSLLSEV